MPTSQVGFIQVNSICIKILNEFAKIYKIDVQNNVKRLSDYLEQFYRTELKDSDAILNISYIQAVADTHNFNLESSSQYEVLKQYEKRILK